MKNAVALLSAAAGIPACQAVPPYRRANSPRPNNALDRSTVATGAKRAHGGLPSPRRAGKLHRPQRGAPAMNETLKPGLTGTARLTVGEEHTAPSIGSGRVRVLATPVMINLMEAAALDAAEALLPACW